MQLDLGQLMQHPGGSMPFAFDLDLSDLTFWGTHPFAEPVHVSGEVRSHAELLLMTGKAETTLHVNCDRCGKPFLRPVVYPFEHMLADRLENDENDEIILLHNAVLEPEAPVRDDVVLGMDSSNLCREDCKGRCPRCGKDLNTGPCACQPETDPRMAVLAQLLERQE